MKVCDAVTKAGCDDDESAYLDKWRGDAAARRTQPGKWHAADSFWLNAAGLASTM